MFLYQIVERLAFLLQLLMWNESILVKGAASCLYSCSILRVTLSAHCVGKQSDSALLFQGLLLRLLRPMQPNWRTCCLPLRPTGMQLAEVSCSLTRSCSNGGTISQARVRLSLNLHCSCRPAVLPFSNECGRLNGSVSRVPLEKD